MNLLKETLEAMNDWGKKPSDVKYVVTDECAGTWEDFAEIAANIEYGKYPSFSYVDPPLSIVFKDGSWLGRVDQDPNQWVFFQVPSMPKYAQPLQNLIIE